MNRTQFDIDLGDGRSAILRVPDNLTRMEYDRLVMTVARLEDEGVVIGE